MRPTRPLALAALIAAPLLLQPAAPARAATATATIAVTATVLSLCAVTALPLAFGNYASTANSDATTTVTVLCTAGTPFTVALDAGAGTGATTTVRRLGNPLSAATPLSYGLFRDAARTQNWGNTTTGTAGDVVAGIGTVLPIPLTVYGRIPSGQNVGTGAYTDTVNVTLTY